ncbi:MAG: 50S ribosomal protein L3 [Nitrospinota bacterium]
MNYALGRKAGMTQVFAPDGSPVPVTVVEVGPCTVVQRKTAEKDGYEAVQLGFLPRKEKGYSKAELGHFKKHGVQPFRVLREVPVAEEDKDLQPGGVVDVTVFDRGDWVDVTSVTKGRGFQGVIKRHKFRGGPGSHGGMFDRLPGSMSASSFPSRIFKGKRLPGHMGAVRQTVQGLLVVDVQPDANVLMVRGAVPGPKNGIVLLRRSIRTKKAALEKPKEQVRSMDPLKASKRAARGG